MEKDLRKLSISSPNDPESGQCMLFCKKRATEIITKKSNESLASTIYCMDHKNYRKIAYCALKSKEASGPTTREIIFIDLSC